MTSPPHIKKSALLNIALEYGTGEPIVISAEHSRAIFICGKRGSGKSYSLGVIAEELAKAGRFLIIVDPLGVFWPMGLVNYSVNVLVPGAECYSTRAVAKMRELGIQISRVTLSPSVLSPQDWCDLFGLSLSRPLGIGLYRAIRRLRGKQFSLQDIAAAIEKDDQSADTTRWALLNRLDSIYQWDLFGEGDITGGLKENCINILDLSGISPGPHSPRNILLALLCRALFAHRVRARQEEVLGLAEPGQHIWLLVDEAHQFAPASGHPSSKDALVRWVKEGRQPGLSLVVVSQQPSAIDTGILSQCDLLMIHRLTAQDDLAAIGRLGQSYIRGNLKSYLRRLHSPGDIIIVDDDSERLWLGRTRPRETPHGGSELSLEEQE